MHPAGEGVDASRLLASAHGAGADEQTEVLPVEGALLPEVAEAVDESLPLGAVVAIASWNSEEEGIIVGHFVGGDHGDGGVLGWCVLVFVSWATRTRERGTDD